MVSQKVTIVNPTGLHLRPAGQLCELAMKFSCNVNFMKDNNNANAKSVLSILGACVKFGDEITIICDGTDENEALEAVIEGIKSGLGEG